MILFALITLSCISAADNNTSDEIITQDSMNADELTAQTNLDDEEKLTDGENEISDFSTLNSEIANSTTSTIQLTKNYTYNPEKDSNYTDGIVIDKPNFTIDGQGHAINGAGLARIFNITTNTVTLKNIKFINGNATDNGGAVYWHGDNGTINDCNFDNNQADNGGAVYWYAYNGTINDSHFTNNTAESDGGAIYWQGTDGNISNCEVNSTFINNVATRGGAIFFNNETNNVIIAGYFEGNVAERTGGALCFQAKSSNNVISADFYNNSAIKASGGAIFFYSLAENNSFESIFMNNYALYGGGIFFYKKANDNIFDSNFTFNVAESCGGAIFFYNTTNNNNFTSYFISNSALGKVDETVGNGGAITFKDVSTNCIFTADFINNTAALNGGGINYRQTPYNITFNGDFNNNNANYGGGASFLENLEDVVFNGEFIGNSAMYGGAIAVNEGVIENASFRNNHAKSGGAIYFNMTGIIDKTIFTNNNADDGGAILTKGNLTISDSGFIGNGENCINVKSGAKLTLNNVSSDVQLVNDTISMKILKVKDAVYGDNVNINIQLNSSVITPLSSGKVVVKVNNVEYSAEVKDGIATIAIPNLDAGFYNANVTYIDNNISRVEIPVNFTVNKKNITINAKDAAYIINYGKTYKVSFVNVTDGVKVTFTLNGKNIGTSTIKNGTASIKLTAKILKTAKAGKKNMVIKIRNSNYNPISKTVKITINKEKTKITAKAKTFKRTTKTKKYVIALKNSKNKAMKKVKVTLKVKGKLYTAKTDSKGKATFKITKLTKKGTFKAVIKYKGNNYYNKVTKNVKIKIM